MIYFICRKKFLLSGSLHKCRRDFKAAELDKTVLKTILLALPFHHHLVKQLSEMTWTASRKLFWCFFVCLFVLKKKGSHSHEHKQFHNKFCRALIGISFMHKLIWSTIIKKKKPLEENVSNSIVAQWTFRETVFNLCCWTPSEPFKTSVTAEAQSLKKKLMANTKPTEGKVTQSVGQDSFSVTFSALKWLLRMFCGPPEDRPQSQGFRPPLFFQQINWNFGIW